MPEGAVKLTCEVETPRHLMRARHVVLAIVGCAALLFASQQCARTTRSRLDAVIERDPLPRSHR